MMMMMKDERLVSNAEGKTFFEAPIQTARIVECLEIIGCNLKQFDGLILRQVTPPVMNTFIRQETVR